MDNENVYEKVTPEMAKMYAEEFTETEYARLDEKFSPQGYFDTLAFAREKLKKGIDVPNYKLESLVKYYFPNNHFEFHNASEDVNATLSIMIVMTADLKTGEEFCDKSAVFKRQVGI